MSLIRRIARPLLAAPFVLQGVRTVRNPEREIRIAPKTFAKVDEQLASSSVPSAVSSRTLVQATGAVAVGAGLLYATHRAPRLSALLLVSTAAVGLAHHKKVWELSGEERLDELQAVLTDAGLLGGVLLAVADTDGSPSLGYRVGKLVERGQKEAAAKQRELERAAKKSDVKKSVKKLSKRATKKAAKANKKLSKRAGKASDTASSAFENVTKTVQDRIG